MREFGPQAVIYPGQLQHARTAGPNSTGYIVTITSARLTVYSLHAAKPRFFETATRDWVEEHTDGGVEVIATRNDGVTLAIEHTIVQPFTGEKFDSHVFFQAFEPIEKNPDLTVAERSMRVEIPVSAIPLPNHSH